MRQQFAKLTKANLAFITILIIFFGVLQYFDRMEGASQYELYDITVIQVVGTLLFLLTEAIILESLLFTLIIGLVLGLSLSVTFIDSGEYSDAIVIVVSFIGWAFVCWFMSILIRAYVIDDQDNSKTKLLHKLILPVVVFIEVGVVVCWAVHGVILHSNIAYLAQLGNLNQSQRNTLAKIRTFSISIKESYVPFGNVNSYMGSDITLAELLADGTKTVMESRGFLFTNRTDAETHVEFIIRVSGKPLVGQDSTFLYIGARIEGQVEFRTASGMGRLTFSGKEKPTLGTFIDLDKQGSFLNSALRSELSSILKSSKANQYWFGQISLPIPPKHIYWYRLQKALEQSDFVPTVRKAASILRNPYSKNTKP